MHPLEGFLSWKNGGTYCRWVSLAKKEGKGGGGGDRRRRGRMSNFQFSFLSKALLEKYCKQVLRSARDRRRAAAECLIFSFLFFPKRCWKVL